MKVLRFDSPTLETDLNGQLPAATNIVVMHLGRGGVMEDGTLDAYNKGRVIQTLYVTSVVEKLRSHAAVRILWTGGHNRKQDRSGDQLPASEGGAAFSYARLTAKDSDMLAEEDSTSTVENATRSSEHVADDDVIVVVTDKLHYLARKVQFIFWMAFPRHHVVFVELPKAPPGTNVLSRAKHLVSTFVTIVGMAGVTRGDATDIQTRQMRLQRITGH